MPKSIIEDFVKEFHKRIIQGHNGAIGLVLRLRRIHYLRNLGTSKISYKGISKLPKEQTNKA